MYSKTSVLFNVEQDVEHQTQEANPTIGTNNWSKKVSSKKAKCEVFSWNWARTSSCKLCYRRILDEANRAYDASIPLNNQSKEFGLSVAVEWLDKPVRCLWCVVQQVKEAVCHWMACAVMWQSMILKWFNGWAIWWCEAGENSIMMALRKQADVWYICVMWIIIRQHDMIAEDCTSYRSGITCEAFVSQNLCVN